MTLIPKSASVTPFEKKMDALNANALSRKWYDRAVSVLRGGDGGEHGLILYGMILRLSDTSHPLVVLDIGTARGFSAMAMARAMADASIDGGGGRLQRGRNRPPRITRMARGQAGSGRSSVRNRDVPRGNLGAVVSRRVGYGHTRHRSLFGSLERLDAWSHRPRVHRWQPHV